MKTKPEYLEYAFWIAGGNSDQSIDYCRACAERELPKYDNAVVDGGWLTEHDTPPQCEICDVPLAGIVITSLDFDSATVLTRREWDSLISKLEAV